MEIVGDARSLERAFGVAQQKSSSFQSALSKGAKVGAGVLTVVGAGMFKAVQAASALEEQVNKTSVVFGQSAPAIHAWAKTTASSIGISNRASLEATGTFGNMLVPMGFARDEAAQMSRRMVELAADMASFNDASPEEVLEALRSGLSGESEPLKRFGVLVDEARVKQEAMTLGLYDGKGAIDANAKAQATLSLILKDTKDAQGDYARTSESAANAERGAAAEAEDTAATLGTVLVPAYEAAVSVATDLVRLTREHSTATKILVGAIAAVSGAVILANAGLSIYNSRIVMAVARTKALRIAMAATPIGLLVTGIALLAGHLLMQRQRTDEGAQAFDRLRAALNRYQGSLNALHGAEQARRDSNLRLQASELAVEQAQKSRATVAEQLRARGVENVRATLEWRQANLAVKQALRERERAEQGVAQANQTVKNRTRENIAATKDLSTRSSELADTYRQKLAEAARTAALQSRGLTVEQRKSNVEAAKSGVVAAYAKELRALAKDAREKGAPAFATWAEKAADLAKSVKDIPSKKTVDITIQVTTLGSTGGLAEHLDLKNDRPAPRVGGRSSFATSRGGALRGGAAPVTINVYVAGSIAAERDLARTIRDELLRHGGRNAGRVGLA